MKLKEYLQKELPELYAKTVQHSIDLKDFEKIYTMSKTGAIKALKDYVNGFATPKEKRSHVDIFTEKYKSIIDDALVSYHKLLDAVNEYYTANKVRISIFMDEDDPIRLGRAPKGSRMRPGRDLRIVYEYIQELLQNGWPVSFDMRIFPSKEDPYESAVLLEDGTIKEVSTGVVYQKPSEYTSKVYRDAVKRGTRESPVGSPWKGLQMQDRRGNWVTLDRIWNDALVWYNGVEFGDDDENEDNELE